MISDAVLVAVAVAVIAALAAIIWLSVRYRIYLNRLRSGSGKRPDKVWKPFWFD